MDYHVILNDSVSVSNAVDMTFIIQLFDSVLTWAGLK